MPFGSLWLPVVVSAVAVWFLSAILHMVLKYHRADHRQLPDEEAVAQALRAARPGPGIYFLPYQSDPSAISRSTSACAESGVVMVGMGIPNCVP